MTETLQDLFGAEDDEQAVLSVCAIPDPDSAGAWRLRHATLLVVPADCAARSWAEWRRAEGDPGTPINNPLPSSFQIDGDHWLLARAVLGLEEANTWMTALLDVADGEDPTGVTLPAAGPVPELRVKLSPPKALIRVFPETDAPASNLVAGLKRPAEGLLWRGEIGDRFPEPQRVELDSQAVFNPCMDTVGIHITSDAVDSRHATPAGLLVARAERRAWIRAGRGSGDFTSFIAHLGWEPSRIDLDDLELTHEEYLDGELVLSTRLRLEDLDTSGAEDLGQGSIDLWTLGRKVAHGLALHTVDGELLDRFGPYPIVERIVMTPVINGHEQPPSIIGITDPPPELEERTGRREEIERSVQDVVRDGVLSRLIADRQTALDRLKQTLSRARGQLLVLDRYFGQDPNDWRLLDGVSVSVRVLTGKIADETPTIGSHVDARHRPRSRRHERVYLWDGGGLALDGSPTTFGQGMVRMVRMRPAEVELMRKEFEDLWSSGLYREVPRTSS